MTTTARTVRPVSALGKTGIIIAVLLAVADIITGATQLGADATLPLEVAVGIIVAGVVTLVVAPFAWRGARWAAIVVVVVRLLSALSAVPAFFVPGLEPGIVIVAAVGIIVAVVAAALILLGQRVRA